MHLTLVPHPAHPPSGRTFKLWANVELSAAFGATATLNIWFGIDAPASRFRIPAPAEPTRADNLWQATCFELFLRQPGSDPYREWNFSPSGEWAAYDFTSYRDGMAAADVGAAPYIRVEDNLTWWTLGATISVPTGTAHAFSLSAVLEEQDGTKSYWALAHPSENPDFHHPDCFVARLP